MYKLANHWTIMMYEYNLILVRVIGSCLHEWIQHVTSQTTNEARTLYIYIYMVLRGGRDNRLTQEMSAVRYMSD